MQTKGKCIYCGQIFSGRGLSRHLATHLKNEPADGRKKSFHLVVDAKPYFLHLLMDGSAALHDLDGFLRAIWLECCGHMSQFGYERWSDNTLKPSTKCSQAFDKGSWLWYAYDFGSTTELIIRCVDVYPIATPEGIRLLSRNEPLDIPCDHCKKKQATELCTVHYGEDEMYFCEDCAEIHQEQCEDADYAMLPVVNSPRMGVCAYEGGEIDIERDSPAEA